MIQPAEFCRIKALPWSEKLRATTYLYLLIQWVSTLIGQLAYIATHIILCNYSVLDCKLTPHTTAVHHQDAFLPVLTSCINHSLGPWTADWHVHINLVVCVWNVETIYGELTAWACYGITNVILMSPQTHRGHFPTCPFQPMRIKSLFLDFQLVCCLDKVAFDLLASSITLKLLYFLFQ